MSRPHHSVSATAHCTNVSFILPLFETAGRNDNALHEWPVIDAAALHQRFLEESGYEEVD